MQFINTSKIPNTPLTIDDFKSGTPFVCLSHFHSDHYGGLTRSFKGIIFCSATTANLVFLDFKVKAVVLEMNKTVILNGIFDDFFKSENKINGSSNLLQKLEENRKLSNPIENKKIPEQDKNLIKRSNSVIGNKRLPGEDKKLKQKKSLNQIIKTNDIKKQKTIEMNKNYKRIEKYNEMLKRQTKLLTHQNQIKVTPINANHCPGAVMFIFEVGSKKYLHTGDFRAAPQIYNEILHLKFDIVFFDNTFENKKNFLSQTESIKKMYCQYKMRSNGLVRKKIAVLCATYSIGKERVFLSLAELMNRCVYVEKRKKKIYDCFDQYSVNLLNAEVIKITESIKKEDFCAKNKSNGIIKRIKSNTTSCNKGLFNFSNFYATPQSSFLNEEEKLSGIIEKCEPKQPFYRIVDVLEKDSIIVVSTQHISKEKINEILKKVDCDYAMLFCGTGWSDKTAYFDLKRGGKTIKNGIEVVYVSYSEHSSNEEIIKFRKEVDYVKIVNTVTKKGEVNYK